MEMRLILALALIAGTAGGQVKPKPKRVPLYKVVLVCPKGTTLYVRQQAGMKSLGPEGAVQILYEWRGPWDGETPLMSDEVDSATCFKGNPPKNGAKP
jgi:hypothetical protein